MPPIRHSWTRSCPREGIQQLGRDAVIPRYQRFAAAACFLTALMFGAGCGSPEATSKEEWLPLTRSELLQLLAEGAEAEGIAVESLRDALEEARSDLAQHGHSMTRFNSELLEREISRYESNIEELNELHASGETVWRVTRGPGEEAAMATMAGKDEAVHTLRIMAGTDRPEAESEALLEDLEALFQRVYPDWPEAREWPKRSLIEAWEMSPLVRQESLENPNDVVITEARGGIISSTVGVPPDVVLYTVTTRERCIPSPDRGNPFARIIC